MKTIVTHFGPDLDAIASTWLIKKYFPGWEEAGVAFVPAGSTLNNLPPDDTPDVIHVDTGCGKFDHHQNNEDTCSALKIYQEIAKNHGKDEAMVRMLMVINEIDHFREAFFPNPTADFWDLSLPAIIDGWRLIHAENPLQIIALGMNALEGAYRMFQNKVWAEKEMKKGIEFSTKWGKALAIETTNDEVVHYGQKYGYVLVIRKDPRKGYVRIKALPKPEIDLTPLYDALCNIEPTATWYLHPSCHMILNGSSKNPDMKPSQKGLSEILEISKLIIGDAHG